MVRVHPATGHRVFYVNPQFTIRIKDMDERESASLLDTLFDQALIREYQCRLPATALAGSDFYRQAVVSLA